MISVDEAVAKVLPWARPRPAISRPSLAAVRHALAVSIACTRDSPPYDKSLVDGYAVRVSDLQGTPTTLRVLEEITAGQIPSFAVETGTATRIMTGAPVPEGADAVVMIERTQLIDEPAPGPCVQVQEVAPRAGQNIMRRGESMRAGDYVISAGHRLRAIEIGLLAELGISDVRVHPLPTVAVLATGNELVPIDVAPGPGQIRNSNGPMLERLVEDAGGLARDLGIARDTEADLTRYVRAGLESDVLLLSGGVSAGVLDLVPAVLEQLGVRQVFHKVHLKPGKPIWFGVLAGPDSAAKLVFGLPGNPVSSLVCFHLFVRPALAQLAGWAAEELLSLPAQLTTEFRHRGDRPTYFPAKLHRGRGSLRVEPLAWRGSADLRTFVDADALIHFPPGNCEYVAGDTVTISLLYP